MKKSKLNSIALISALTLAMSINVSAGGVVVRDNLNRARDIYYDKTDTSLTSDTVQDAIDELDTNMSGLKSDVDEELEELKKSVADGKALISSAITSKGIETSSEDTFATMASNISSIEVMTEESVNRNYELYTCYVVNDSGTITSHNSYSRAVTYTCPYYGKVEITMNNRYMGGSGRTRTVIINGVTKYCDTASGSNQLSYDVSKGDVLYTCVSGQNTGSHPKSYAHIVHFSGFKEK